MENKMTLAEWVQKYLAEQKQGTVKSQTLLRDQQTAALLCSCAAAAEPLDRIAPRTIMDLLREVQKRKGNLGNNYSRSSIKKVKSLATQSLRWAYLEGVIDTRPYLDIPVPIAPVKKVVAFTHREEQLIRAACASDPQGHLILFLLCTGLRRAELCGLCWNDYDPHRGCIYIRESKTAAGVRTVFLLKEAQQIIEQQPRICHAIFTNTRRTPVSPSSLRRLCQRIEKRTQIHIACHVFRHTFVTRLCEKGVPAAAIAKIIGHAQNGYVLDIYAQLEVDEARQAIYALEA